MRFITLFIGWPFLKGETDRGDSPVNRHLTDERSEKCAATRWKSITLLASLQKHLLKRERELAGLCPHVCQVYRIHLRKKNTIDHFLLFVGEQINHIGPRHIPPGLLLQTRGSTTCLLQTEKSLGLIGDCFTLGVLEKVWMIETKEKHKRNNWTAMETVAFCWPLMEEKKRETCGQLCSD